MAGNRPSNPEDRRNLRRFPAAELKASLRVKKGLFGDSWVAVKPQDYNKRGLSIDTSVELNTEEEVVVGLELVMDMGSIQIEKLAGVVRYAKQVGMLYRYGIEFDFESARFMRSTEVESQLARIESILERSQHVADRIQSQQEGKTR